MLVKPSAGGGGKGMRMVDDAAELPAALAGARRESASAFGDDTLFLERFVLRPRHIEVQVLADAHGNVIHLGERECSLQRRHQKVIEEAPSPLLDAATRARIGAAACDTARSVDYVGAGTVEFIVSADRPDEFFFMEMNTRLQVEHPVTEMVTGWDLVEWQVRIAAGEKLAVAQDDVAMTGHAIEARVYAEDPGARLPADRRRRCSHSRNPTGQGVRVDSGLLAGTVVGSDYDPMLAKVIAYGDDRAAALRGLDRALADTAVLGVVTNIDFLRFLLADPDVVAGRSGHRTAGPAGAATTRRRPASDDRVRSPPRRTGGCDAGPARRPTCGRCLGLADGRRAPRRVCRLRSGERTDHVRITGTPDAATAAVEDGETRSLTATLDGDRLTVTLGRSAHRVPRRRGRPIRSGCRRRDGVRRARGGARGAGAARRRAQRRRRTRQPHARCGRRGQRRDGATVAAGTVVVTVEAMKMEHSLTAPVDGVVELLVAVGDQVKVGQPLARITATPRRTESADD